MLDDHHKATDLDPGQSRDLERTLTLLSIAYRRSISPDLLVHIEAADADCRRGDKALACIRLAQAGLYPLDDPTVAHRLGLAKQLLDAGMAPRTLMIELGLEPINLRKYDQNEPRVPAGEGRESGRWQRIFDAIGAYLQRPVPVYDADTGIQYGTQSRGRAIATNPITVGTAGAIAFFAAEATVAAVAFARLPAFTRAYLTGTGGPWGGAATRKQLYEIAKKYRSSGEFVEFEGGGMAKEEYIEAEGFRSRTFVDFTAKRADGSAVRVQTIDTLADGVTPTRGEANAAARIRDKFPDDELILIPKKKP